MTTLRITFPAGRYHATPWGHHVNEGLVEWPPSPWRMLRALLAVGFAKHGWTAPAALPGEAVALFTALAGVLPRYRLPAGGVAHTRHYLPITEGKTQKTTKVLDAFVRIPDGNGDEQALFIHWPVALPAGERALLGALASGLSYLGRAEAWAEAALVEGDPPDDQWTCPIAEGHPAEPGWEQVAVLAPVSADTYAAWRQAQPGTTEAKPGKAKRKTADAVYPTDLLACLCADTALLHKQGWSQPPGSRRVLYRRPADCLQPAIPVPRHVTAEHATVRFALLALSADTASGSMRPLMSRCLRQAEFLHDAWVRQLGPDARHVQVSGRNPDGSPAAGHRHAHLIPLDLDRDGRIDQVLVWAPDGLDDQAQRALLRIDRTWGKDLPPLVVACAGMGSEDEVVSQLRDRSGRLPPELGLAPAGTARVWTSATPLVLPRFRKPNGANSWQGQIAAECRSRGLPEPVAIDLGRDELVHRGFLHYLRARAAGHPQPPSTTPWCVRLTFPTAVNGPLCLGYGSHFGLGLFRAEA